MANLQSVNLWVALDGYALSMEISTSRTAVARAVPNGSTVFASQPHDSNAESAANAAILDEVNFSKFKPTKGFSQDNAVLLAALATASYSYPEHQKACLDHQAGVKSFVFLDSKNNEGAGAQKPDTDTQVSLVDTGRALLVAARGTTPPWDHDDGQDSEWNDFQTDITAVPVWNYDKSGKVHKGFKDAADGIWDQLKPYLMTAISSHKAIYLSGHSLGAAIALQLADRMVVELHSKPSSVIRMGGPDVGWEDEQKHLEKVGLTERTFNFINCTDPVPGTLPNGVPAGIEVYLDRHGKADISGKSHALDKTLGAADNIYHGHTDITHHHHPQYYNQHIAARENAATFKQLEK